MKMTGLYGFKNNIWLQFQQNCSCGYVRRLCQSNGFNSGFPIGEMEHIMMCVPHCANNLVVRNISLAVDLNNNNNLAKAQENILQVGYLRYTLHASKTNPGSYIVDRTNSTTNGAYGLYVYGLDLKNAPLIVSVLFY